MTAISLPVRPLTVVALKAPHALLILLRRVEHIGREITLQVGRRVNAVHPVQPRALVVHAVQHDRLAGICGVLDIMDSQGRIVLNVGQVAGGSRASMGETRQSHANAECKRPRNAVLDVKRERLLYAYYYSTLVIYFSSVMY